MTADGPAEIVEPPEVPDPGAMELLAAFHSAYNRIGHTAVKVKDVAAFVYALAEVLVRHGVVGMDEIDEARRKVEQRFDDQFRDAGVTIQLLTDDTDKYEMEAVEDIDCADRIALCQAACCRLRFPLSEQDIGEGVVHWALAEPYLNRLAEDGWCIHSSAAGRACQVYEHRPSICRTYDCRGDLRIWTDFENRVVNPDLAAALVEPVAQPVAAPTVRETS